MPHLTKLLDLSERLLAAACVAALAIMFVLGLATVFFRFVVQSSLAFPEELILYLFVWITFLGSAITLRRNAHAAIGIFVSWLPDVARRIALLTATVTSGLFFLILIVKGGQLTARVAPQISPALEISMAWAYAAVPVGSFFMMLFTIELLARQITAPASELSADGI